jgi:electron transfer flavoprotein beta subunit
VTVASDRAVVTYALAGGRNRTCELALPCVIAAGRGLNTPSYPTFPDVVKARKKPVQVIALDTLAIDTPPGSVRVVGLEPLWQTRTPRPITGSPREIAARIAAILKEEAKVVT